jgi:hypothetical protein
MNFSAVLIFHNEYKEVYRTIESLWAHNECEIFIGRDALPLEKAKFKKFNVFFLEDRSCMEDIYALTRMGRDSSEIELSAVKKLLLCNVNRMYEAARKASSDKILYLEPDVLIRGKLNPVQDLDMDTVDSNEYGIDFLSLVEKISSRKVNFVGWGYCTGFASTSGFVDVYKWIVKNQEQVDQLISMDYRMMYADFAFPILFHIVGRSIGNSKMITECNRDFFWRINRRPIVHQFKR